MVQSRELARARAPFLAESQNAAFTGGLIIATPIGNFCVGCRFDRSISRESFYPTWFATLLCDPNPMKLNFGERLKRDGHSWRISEPNIDETLCNAVRAIWPTLEGLSTYPNYLGFLELQPYMGCKRELSMAVAHACMGNFAAAAAVLTQPLKYYRDVLSRSTPPVARQKMSHNPRGSLYESYVRDVERMEHIQKLARDDVRALLAELHANEQKSGAELKMEKYWTPAPFPCEVGGKV
jgi:hypothetical protein